MTGVQPGPLGSYQHMLTALDGHEIRVNVWMPSSRDSAAAIVQVLHGVGEHVARYQRFAHACCEHGFIVMGHDHRGHGPHCDPPLLGHFADRDGWSKLVQDAIAVQRFAARTGPGIPIVLFGHSMGSFVAQSVAVRESAQLGGLILSASTFSPRLQLRLGRLLARLALMKSGGRQKSPLLNRLGFANFNSRFAPNRTAFDWLSRDEAEVDRYAADPLCGMPLSNRLWLDLLSGMLEITSKRRLGHVRAALPILITGGGEDPVGGRRGQNRLARAYEHTAHRDVTLRLYPGGRHEMLNETNRDEFTRDVLEWIDGTLASRSGGEGSTHASPQVPHSKGSTGPLA